MNFNISRFALTVRKDFSDLRRVILATAIGSVTLITIADTVLLISYGQMYMSALRELLGGFNVFFILIAITASASVAFKPLDHQSSATSMLMLPASSTEKFLSRWLLAVPCSLVLFIGAAYVGDVLSTMIVQFVTKVVHHNPVTDWWRLYLGETIDGQFFGVVVLFLQSFFFLGSLLWPRLSWCKSLITITLLSVIYINVVIFVINSYLPASHMNVSLTLIGRSEVMAILQGLTVINYVISFFRFREADIINRL